MAIPLDWVLAAARIALGLMFAAKLYFSIDAERLVWAHRLPWGSRRVLHVLLAALVIANVCFIVGFATGPAALAQWALYLGLYRYASLYGLEDVSFHTLIFYFVFAGAGASGSLDSVLGTGVWGRIPAGSLIPELALTTAFGNIFLSAGITKLVSPMWRQGIGAYYFFLLPNFRRCSTSLITRFEPVIRAINHLALVMELGMLPAFLLNSVPLGIAFWAMGIGFTILLSTVFVLTWIGEAMTVGMVIVAWLLWDSGGRGLAVRWREEVLAPHSPAEQLLVGALVVTLLAALWTALMPDVRPIAARTMLARLYRGARLVARFTWGFLPCDVFTETHMTGSIVYRVYAEAAGQTGVEVFRIYGATCGPGPDRFLRPTFYEVTSYKVAEACMELDLYREVRTTERRRFILGLADYIRRTSRPALTDVSALTFKVVQLVPPAQFAGCSTDWYANEPWTDAFVVDFEAGEARRIRRVSDTILKSPTGRNLDRVSFEFLPTSN